MADKIKELADSNATAKSQVEEGLRESFQEQGKDIPSNFVNIVNSITALINEYGIKSETLEYGHQVTFSLFGAGNSIIAGTILNYGVSDDPWPKAVAKALAGVAYDLLGGFTGIGVKGVTNVALGYGVGNVLTNIVDKGYDIIEGPDYEIQPGKTEDGKRFTNISVDYTLQDALLIPDKLRDFLKAKNIIGDWKLTDRNGNILQYENDLNTYILPKNSLASATNSELIDGLFMYDNQGTYPLKVQFSDTATLTLKPLYLYEDTLASMAKKDGRVMYALNNLKSYYIDGSTAPVDDPSQYSENYINDRALLLYVHNWVKKDAQAHYKDVVDALFDPQAAVREFLGAQHIYIVDNKNGVEYGRGSLTGSNRFITFGSEGSDEGLSYSANDDHIYGLGGNDHFGGGAGNDILEGGVGEDRISGGDDIDTIFGGNDSDILNGDGGNDTLIDGDDDANDTLIGGIGSDTLVATKGNDTLIGGSNKRIDRFGTVDLYAEKERDYLVGGTGNDKYYVSHQDVIYDEDGMGLIRFNEQSLSGKKTQVEDNENLYEDDKFFYEISGADLIVTEKTSHEFITILDFDNKELGIVLGDPDGKEIELYTGDATVTEGGKLEFIVAITEELKYDLTVDVSSYWYGDGDGFASADDFSSAISGQVTIKAGELNTSFTISTKDDEKVA
jgi:Ca2+-binding RTX toxin-like protein